MMTSTAGNPRLAVDETVVVSRRVRQLNNRGSFLQLADGRGWVLDFRKGQQQLHRVSANGNAGDSSTPCSAWSTFSSGAFATGFDSAEDSETPALILASGATAASAVEAQLVSEPEFGEWLYLVLDHRGVHLRVAATYDQRAKLPDAKVREGELVKVVERRMGAGTTFLRLEDPSGWGFDVQPDQSCDGRKRQRMAEVRVECGTWFYRVCTPKGITLRSRCSFADDAKTGQGPKQGAILTVSRRLAIGETTFLELQDGSGWAFDKRGGRCVAEGPLSMQSQDVTASLLRSCLVLTEPTEAKWAQTQKMLLEGAKVQVDLIGNLDERTWVHVCKPAGMEGWLLGGNLDFR